METEKEHDELVEEVMKKLAENNLYMKLKKCKQKMKEVGFLEVVIGLERIKMKEEKVKDVLNWPTPKYVKDIYKSSFDQQTIIINSLKTSYLQLDHYMTWLRKIRSGSKQRDKKRHLGS